jgi:hypothetical protein
MNKQQKLTLILSVGLSVGLSGWFAQSSLAQVNPTGANGYQENERDSFTGGNFGNNFNPMDLIHNSNFRRSRNSAEFQEDTQTELQNAADEFKRQQQERIQNQPTETFPNQ